MTIKSVCVFTGASDKTPKHYIEAAQEVGSILGSNRYQLVYGGGGTGLMGAVSSSAIQAGGHVLGITTKLLAEYEKVNTTITEVRVVEDMHKRKNAMYNNSNAFLILPGGIGTLDECFEIITWKQLEIHNQPILIYNYKGYWDPLKALFSSMTKEGFVKKKHIEMLYFFDKPTDLLPLLQSF